MNDGALIAELEKQREIARQYFEHIARQEELGVSLPMPTPGFSETLAPIKAVLTAHPMFGPGRNIFFATKQLNLHPQFISLGLLRVTLDSDASSAVAWLHRLHKINRTDLRMVAAVHGLEVKQPVSLANRVLFLPFAAAPDSANLRGLASRYRLRPGSMPDMGSVIHPTIATFDMGIIDGSADHAIGKATHDSAYTAILDATRAFTLTEGCAPVVGNSWTDFVDPSLTQAEFGQMWMSARFEGSLSQRHPPTVDDEAVAWANRYLLMDPSLRLSVDVGLDRLNLARRRKSPGDQAIDAGICLEALLGDDSPQELSYRLRLRAALLLGTSLAERQEIWRAVRDLYELRSKVVHGRARRDEDTAPDSQRAVRGLEICTQAVRAIVMSNVRPDFSILELTGGQRDR